MRSLGGTSSWVTPVPISNTEVKPRWADDTWGKPTPGKVGGRRDLALFVFSSSFSEILAWMDGKIDLE